MTEPTAGSRAELAARIDQLLREAHASPDPDVTADLLEQVLVLHGELLDQLAASYGRHPSVDEDFQRTAREAFATAIAQFDPHRDGELIPFAVPAVVRRLRMRLREEGWTVRPRTGQRRESTIRRVDDPPEP